MTALQTPAPDAPAEEWGRLAVSIPGWQWPISTDSAPEPDMHGLVRDGQGAWRRTPYAQSKYQWTQHYGKGECVPNPDHWAWWGWFILLLGPERIQVTMWGDEITVGTDNLVMEPSAFGRACIAAAAANGRWPGGDS